MTYRNTIAVWQPVNFTPDDTLLRIEQQGPTCLRCIATWQWIEVSPDRFAVWSGEQYAAGLGVESKRHQTFLVDADLEVLVHRQGILPVEVDIGRDVEWLPRISARSHRVRQPVECLLFAHKDNHALLTRSGFDCIPISDSRYGTITTLLECIFEDVGDTCRSGNEESRSI